MAPATHIIDPEADTIVTLKDACASFAPWRSKETVQDDGLETWSLSSSRENKVKNKANKIQIGCHQLLPDNGNPEITASRLGGNLSTDTMRFDTPSTCGESDEDDVHYHVSSRHLMLASPVFKCALRNGGFEESIRNEDGLYRIKAYDWDAEAFLIVMRIVHGRNKQVPRDISLEMLAKIAVIEDYYLFGETLEMFSDLWFRNIEETSLPTTYCRDLMLWIWTTWVFNVETHFREATMVAIRHSATAPSTLGLPLPTKITDNLEHKRYYGIENIMLGLQKLIQRYESNSYTCPYDTTQSFACGSFLLGALTKGMKEADILHPQPAIPFEGLSVEELCTRLKRIKSPVWISWTSRTTHRCKLEDALTTLVTNASTTIQGLDLASFKRRIVHGLED